jgi:hypothetical protein
MNEQEDMDQDMLRALARQTAALPREIEPPTDAWNRIRDEIESGHAAAHNAPLSATRWWQHPQFLMAAGITLVAATSYITAVVVSRRANEGAAMTASANAPSRPGTASLAQFTAIENNYIETANRFTQILDSQQNDLAPGTVAKLKESVRVIDTAILEARRALAADPSNKALMEMLMASYSQKVDLLKRTTEMGQS